MNIIITLPLRFINAMRKKEKHYEMRKSAPVYFDMQNDIVYVCENLEEICISKTELVEYAQNHPTLMLYNIESFIDIAPRPISEFGIQKPPQSFAYTQVRQAVQ